MTSTFDWPDEYATLRRGFKTVTVFGKLVVDMILKSDDEIVIDGNIDVEPQTHAGGAPANVTFGLAQHGVSARLAGWVGADSSSVKIISQLESIGIQLAAVQAGESVTAIVVATPKSRSVFSSAGSGWIGPDEIERSWFEGSAVVHFDGFDLLDKSFPETVLAAANAAHSSGALVSIDACAANQIAKQGVDVYLERIANLQPHVIFANRAEAEVLDLENRDFSFQAPLVVVHSGAEPTRVSRRIPNGQGKIDTRQFEVPVQRTVVVDPTGCGDAFAAGFLSAWTDGKSLVSAVGRAHIWAAEVAMVVGGHLPPESRPQAMLLE